MIFETNREVWSSSQENVSGVETLAVRVGLQKLHQCSRLNSREEAYMACVDAELPSLNSAVGQGLCTVQLTHVALEIHVSKEFFTKTLKLNSVKFK